MPRSGVGVGAPSAYVEAPLGTVTPLGGGGTFVSPWVDVTAIAAIRIACLSDVAGTLTTQHSDDGVTILRSSNQPIVANLGEFLSFHPRAKYFRIFYTNGSTPQTLFHLQTIFHTVALSPTQSLFVDSLSRQSLSTQTRAVIYDFNYDETAAVAPQISDLFVVQRISIIADNFRQTGGLDTILWGVANTGTGASAVTNSRLELTTGTTANSSTKTTSNINGRLISGSHQVFRVGVQLLNNGDTNCVKRWGVYDDNNGYFFELDGTSLYAVSRQSGTDTRVLSTSWSAVSNFALEATGGSHRYEIAYFGNTALFGVDGDVYHKMSGTVGGLPRTATVNFPNRFEIFNKNGAAVNNSLYITGTSQQRYGPDQASPRFLNITTAGVTTVKNHAGRLRRIIINNGAGTDKVVVYDNTAASGLKIATVNLNKNAGNIEFDTDYSIGLTIDTTGNGASSDITVVFD